MDTSEKEELFFNAISGRTFRTLDGTRKGDALFRSSLIKAFLSSPVACSSTIGRRMSSLDTAMRKPGYRGDRSGGIEDQKALKMLKELVNDVDVASFTRYTLLLAQLKDLKVTGKKSSPRVVVFSERVDTIRWLNANLQNDLGIPASAVVEFTGNLPDIVQQDLLKDFGSGDSKIRILLASDVASEGINLHHMCSRLIHFDIPWSLIRLEQRNGRIDRFGQKHNPQIRYLVTESEAKEISDDVAILKALAVKEDQARKNLGSVDGVLGVYTQEAEERRIREAMEAGESPEAAVEPKGNEAQTAADFSVFFDDLSSDYKPLRESKPLLRLIDDDVLYVKMGLELLDDNAPDEGRSSVTGLHIDEEQKFVQFVPPQDLGQRLSFVPREAIQREDLGGGKKGAKLLRMSADRSAVMDSIEQALEKKDAWPDLHLLWERHPAVEWLTDRLLVVLGRNEAPVVALSSLSSTDCVFVFQSILSNGRGRPIFVDWFGIPVRRRQREKGEELEELLDSWDWHKELPNPGTVSESRLAMLQQLIPLAVDGAREWMGRERLRVLEETRPCMAEEHNRLEKWLAKKEAAVREKYDGKARRARRSVSPHEEDLIRREIDDGKRIFEHHAGELQRMLTPERTPYLRLAAVFCAQDR